MCPLEVGFVFRGVSALPLKITLRAGFDILVCFQVFQVCVGTLSSMAVCLQVVGLLLGVVSWCLQSSCTSSQAWKVSSQAEAISTSQWLFEGLWMSCATNSMGSLQCSKFKTVLGLPGEDSPLSHKQPHRK